MVLFGSPREWGTNMQRDSLASHIGHSSRLLYFAAAENQSTARMRVKFLNKMVQPVGPPPAKENEDQLFPS
jgi:splicing factor 3B subunit 5